MKKLLTLLLLFTTPTFAAQDTSLCVSGHNAVGLNCQPIGNGFGLPVTSAPQTASGTTSAVSLGTSSTLVIAANAATIGYSICNMSTSANVACNLGGTAVINGAGSYTFGAGQCLTNSPFVIDKLAINCIASGAATPLTVQVK